MNFLAHALLAGDAPALIVGGVIGDWIKGPLPGALPDDLAKGVALHRAIDSYAESNPAFCRSRSRVSADRRRYAGVLVDVFYDHLLARNWVAIHNRPLDEYCAGVYRLIEDTAERPPRFLASRIDADGERGLADELCANRGHRRRIGPHVASSAATQSADEW